MKKRILFTLTIFMLVLSIAGCSVKNEAVKINIGTIKGPTGIGMSKLMNDSELGETANTYSFDIAETPDITIAKIISGELDAAAVPSNLALSAFNKTNGDVQCAAVVTLGTLYILENGTTINSMADLKGKTIYTFGQGANPEYVINYLLKQNGLTAGVDVNIEFKAQADEVSALMASGEITVSMLPEPSVSAVLTNNSNIRKALNLSDEWDNVSDSNLTMSTLVVRKEFVDVNKKAFDKFLEEYSKSIEYVNQNLDDAAGYCEKYGIIPKAAIAKKAIPGCNIKFISGEDMISSISGYYEVLFNAEPKSVGGKLPDENFYYKK